ncbi:uncharacterized protein LOC119111559 [Pollicipes pollicipes]|uniref:uncharacterized protein LOC119111559 n=1 Tax=Pollicipes pollicipes TaxID=41117 RepID=UPI001884CDC8|nr:uncharacterized protein LOC119111559 [Pollicipes pollicipes]
MFGCGDFVFNVSRPGNRPLRLKIPVYGHATWKALDRQFVEFVISELPSSPLARWSLLLRVIIIPDEHFFATVLMNSRYSDTLLRAKVHHPKRFQGENPDGLCRHRDVVEFCGKGPATVAPRDIDHLWKFSGRFFFARKFPSNISDPTRAKYRATFARPYYESIQHVFPPWLPTYIAKISLQWLEISDASQDDIITNPMQVYPRLEPISDCCEILHRRENQAVFSYAYILDFSTAGAWYRSRVRVTPPVRCYPGGHLRSVRATTDPPPDRRHFGARLNAPIPHLPAGAASLLVELWFHAPERWTAAAYEACDRQPHPGALVFPRLNVTTRTSDPVRLRVQLWEGHTLRCSTTKEVRWSSQPPGPGTPPWARWDLHMSTNVTLPCGHLGPGQRTLQVYDDDAAEPASYELELLFVSWYVEPEGSTADFWQVEDAAPLDDLELAGSPLQRPGPHRQPDEL